MKEHEREGRSGAIIAVLIVAVLAIPTLYVLSVGPAAYIYDRLDSNSWMANSLQMIYMPLAFACDALPATRDALSWYLRVWGSG